MKKILFITGMAIIPGLFSPALAGFRFEGLAPFNESYCSGEARDARPTPALDPEAPAPSSLPVARPRPWAPLGCKSAETPPLSAERKSSVDVRPLQRGNAR